MRDFGCASGLYCILKKYGKQIPGFDIYLGFISKFLLNWMRFGFRPLRVHTLPFPPYRGGFYMFSIYIKNTDFIKILQHFRGQKRLSPVGQKQQYMSKFFFHKDFATKRQKRRIKGIQRTITSKVDWRLIIKDTFKESSKYQFLTRPLIIIRGKCKSGKKCSQCSPEMYLNRLTWR